MITPSKYPRQLKMYATLGLLIALFSFAAPAAAVGKPKTTAATPATSSTKTTTQSTESVTQSYNADSSVQTGMIVQLNPKDTTSVIPVSIADVKNILGVTVPNASATIVLTPANVTKQQVLVATAGTYSLLVTNQNGPIKIGDFIAVSAISGVGMKADGTQVEVIGKAAQAFSGTSNVLDSTKLTDSTGHQSTVALGRIALDMNISHNPLYQKSADYVPGFLANVAIAIANKPVSVAKIYLGTVVLVTTTVITAILIYGGVRSGMIAVGRNPLSRKSIIRSLIQTVAAGMTIFIVGVFAVYLLLKL